MGQNRVILRRPVPPPSLRGRARAVAAALALALGLLVPMTGAAVPLGPLGGSAPADRPLPGVVAAQATAQTEPGATGLGAGSFTFGGIPSGTGARAGIEIPMVPPPDPDAPPDADAPIRYARTLEDLGFVDGLELDRLSDTQTAFFPVPQNVDVDDLVLRLRYEANVPNYRVASMNVLVDGEPVMVEVFEEDREIGDVEIPLDPAVLDDGFIRVDFRQRAAYSDDRCFDERAAPGFVTVDEATGIRMAIDSASVQDLATAWAVLPDEVVVAVGGLSGATPEGFRAAWAIGTRLQREGRSVVFVDGATGQAVGEPARIRSDIVVGPPGDTSYWMGFDALAPAATRANTQGLGPGAGGSAHLIRAGNGRPVIAVTSPEDWLGADLIGGGFRPLANAPDMSARLVEETGRQRLDRITFAELGFAELELDVIVTGEWGFDFGTTDLPADRLPTGLDLHISSAPPVTDVPSLVSVFFNGDLLWSRRLDEDGGRERFTIDLPPRLLRLGNALRVVLQRDAPAGNCETELTAYPAQILTSSALLLGSPTGEVVDFTDLALRFDPDTAIHLPQSLLASPRAPLTLLTHVASQTLREPLPPQVSFYGAGSTPTLDRPFLLVGQPAGIIPEAPVRFDRGRVILTDVDGRTVLDVSGSRDLAAIQVARVGGVPGLWITAPENRMPAPAELPLTRGDIAFVDPTGVVLTLASEQDTIVEVTYPDVSSWFDLFAEYRYYLLAALWVLVTIIIILALRRLYRASRDRG
ncbi:MAG: hypothetical protein GVY28_13405 [Alphaproteobacteria bacterium]|jgi:hypothetical protein|nr:hypothetical protein [Alphaproteobacteria bacterium]